MDRYLPLNHLELSEEPSFIRWAKGSIPLNSDDWDSWLSEHPEKVQTAEKAKAIVLAMKFVEDQPTKKVEEKIWSAIVEDINTQYTTTRKSTLSRRKIIQWIAYGAAAAIAMVFFFQNIGSGFDTAVTVPYAKKEVVSLPDGSSATVNAGSTLEYDKSSWNENRKIALQGEAFFDVKKGSTFTVETEKGSVEVLGTSFNVYDRADAFKVHCETGKVLVKSSGKETELNPDQSITVKDKQHVFVEKVPESENRSAWRKGVFVYRSVDLRRVIEEVRRQFAVEIDLPQDFNDVQYTGSFKTTDLETALTEVLYPLSLNFEIDGKTVRIQK